MTFAVIGWTILGMALLGVAFNLIAAGLLRRPAPARVAAALPAVTILKPLAGAEPALELRLESVYAQAYAAPVQIVFGVADGQDPALAIARQVASRHPDIATDFVIDAGCSGPNRKLSNLANMAGSARHPVIVAADSDIGWPPDTLARLVARLMTPGVGLVSCRHAGHGDAGFWSQLAAMDISYRFMPSVVLGAATGLAQPAMGPTMAFSADTLARIGGFAAFAHRLADDYEIGRAVRALGLRTELSEVIVTHGCRAPTLADLFVQELRWSITIFRIDPAGFVGSVLTHAVPLALVGLLLLPDIAAGAVLALALGARLAVKRRMDRLARRSSGALILLPLRDLLSFAVFCATFFTDKVDWRGSQFRVTRDGRLF